MIIFSLLLIDSNNRLPISSFAHFHLIDSDLEDKNEGNDDVNVDIEDNNMNMMRMFLNYMSIVVMRSEMRIKYLTRD